MFVNQRGLLFLTQTFGKQPQKHGKYYAVANINIKKKGTSNLNTLWLIIKISIYYLSACVPISMYIKT